MKAQFTLNLPEDTHRNIIDFVKKRNLTDEDRLVLAMIAGLAILRSHEWSFADKKLLALQIENIVQRIKDKKNDEGGHG